MVDGQICVVIFSYANSSLFLPQLRRFSRHVNLCQDRQPTLSNDMVSIVLCLSISREITSNRLASNVRTILSVKETLMIGFSSKASRRYRQSHSSSAMTSRLRHVSVNPCVRETVQFARRKRNGLFAFVQLVSNRAFFLWNELHTWVNRNVRSDL